MKNLDAMDRSILRALQENGRLTNTELADRINLSQTATAERVKRLTREGYILGYSARLSPKRLDRAMLVFIEIKLDRTTPEVFETFSTFTRSNPDILECHMVAGGFDYLVKARVVGHGPLPPVPFRSPAFAAGRTRIPHLCGDGRSEGNG